MATFRQRLTSEGRRRRDHRVPRIALQSPSMAAFATLFELGSDQALITVTDIDHIAFRYLLRPFQELYYKHTPYHPSGQIRLITRPILFDLDVYAHIAA